MHNAVAGEQPLELYDIYGLWHVPFWQRTWFIALMSVLVLLVCLIVAYIVWQKYKAKKPPMPVWQKAVQALQRLKAEHMLTRDKSERYYVALTHLLKEYISEQFGHDIRSLTDQQVGAYLQKQPLLDKHKEQLGLIFSAGELIKFAHQDAIEKQMSVDWQHAHDFIIYTKGQP